MASSLRSIPSLRPPSRPKKQPSPRLTPRRSTEGKGGSGILSLESRLMGPENDVENCNSFGSLEGGASSPTDSKPLNGASMNITSSVPTSPLKSTPRSLARRERQLQHRQREEAATKEQQQQQQSHPMSPPTTIGEPLATLSPSLETENVDFVKSPVQNQQQSNRTTSDEDLAPLTPRNLVMEANGGAAEQAEFTLTPPVSSPTPLIVSAKRLGNEVRRGKNGAKRRRPLDEDSSTSSSSDDDDNKMMLPAEMSPTQRTQEYWRRCYGNTQLPQQLLNSQTSWSASRAAPAKSCLSHSKPKRKANAHTKIMLPPTSALLKSPPVATAGSPVFSTPRSSPDDIIANHPQHKCSHNKSVQFGCAQAAEYDIDAPSAKLTPLPPDVAQQRYPLTYSREEHEEEEVAETKENSAVLAEWDSLMDDSDCEDDEEESQMAAAKPKRHHPSIKRRSNSNKKHRKDNRSDRRRSGSFSSHPLNNSRALFDPSLDDDDDHFMDSSITPEKNTNAGVLDTMASLSMASPAPLRNGSAHATHFANTAGSSDDELSPSAAQFQSHNFFGVENIWENPRKGLDVLDQDKYRDPATILFNASMSPDFFWGDNADGHFSGDNNDSSSALVDLPASLFTCLGVSMDRAIEWLENNNQHGSQSNELEHASQEILEQCERLARFELQKHELDLLKTAKEQIDAFKEEVQKAIYVVQTVIFTDAASRAPTSKQIDVIEQDIEKLEQMIAEEKKKQDEKKRAQDAAMLNKGMLKTSFSSLMFFTMDLVCPFALEMDKPVYRVVFGHIVQGLRTTFELGDFGSNCVEQNALQPYNTKPIPKEHLAANFYDALLCSTEGSGVQEPILTPWTDPEDISCNLLDLSVVLGRMDMVALCLQDLMEAYDVSLHQLTENGCPVVVVRVHLPRKTTLDAHYVRTNHRSVFWSLPAIVRVKQDGKICDALTPNFLKIEKCRSLSATVGYLRAACEIVLETVSRQVSVSTG